MAAKKSTKKAKSNIIVLDLNAEQTELLANIPWFNTRYLLPGEAVSDYDNDLQRLVESIEVKDPLDAILAKDIHDDLREVQRMRALRQAILLRGMRNKLTSLLSGPYGLNDNSQADAAFTLWESNPENGYEAILILLEEVGVTMDSLQADAFSRELKELQLLDIQLGRYEKNIRETLKMIDARNNHKVMRQRIEFDLEQDQQKRLIDKTDGH